MMTTKHNLLGLKELREEADRLEARVAELETALQPFADVWWDWLIAGSTYEFTEYMPPRSAFRRAAAALEAGDA